MSYPPPHDHGRYPQDGYYDDRSYRGRDRRDDGAATVANIIRVVVSTVIAIFALHVLFVVLDANQGNGFVTFIYTLAKALVLGLGDVFTPDDALLGVILNYGLAALVYLVVGQLIIKAIRRR
ncbi:hypothetical protein OU415_01200 [Saccharopolyspora sp. WRP15-2]|uniref:YggT family protein n=1 Tax=Saccharopolyspora oryzae TaxID=2997343 RepID=A0ABT4UQN1_9PSEU|nr:hypothetical protein [Saccharopolyspora oryzae]MDA3624030.1 hypothetical protein [Saccharopolyspora oryzae]